MVFNLERYRVFYYTARELSFSRAAEVLYISQPAVSQAIKQLEEEVGGQLFLRTSRGVKLTDEGEVLYKHVEQAFKLLESAEQKLSEIHNLMGGSIKIGASDTLCKYYLLPYLDSFHKKYPRVRIQVTNRTTPETIKLLKSGDVDLGIINLPFEDEQILIKKARTIQECFVVGEKYKTLAQGKISLFKLVDYPILLLEKGTNTRKFVDEFISKYGLILNPEIELGSIDVLVQFARIGLGISYVIRDFVEEELKNGHLYEVILEENIPERSIGIATLKDIPLPKAAETFIDLMRQTML